MKAPQKGLVDGAFMTVDSILHQWIPLIALHNQDLQKVTHTPLKKNILKQTC